MNAPDIRLPPHSIEAEQSMIGGLLIGGPAAWDRVADLATDADLYRDDHRRIFRHIRMLAEAGKPLDVVTVFEAIERSNEVEQTGGLSYLGEIANATPSAANIRRYAEIVRERATLRALCEAADAIKDACLCGGTASPEKIAQRAEIALANALDRDADDPVSANVAMSEVLATADDRQQAGQPAGIGTGIADLDAIAGGLLAGQLFVIAARPSVGKTAVAIAIADHVAHAGGRVAFFSLEMSRHQIAGRLLAARSGVPVHALRTGPNDDQWGRLADAGVGTAGDNFIIDDKAAATLAHVRARCRRLHRQGGLSLVVIDYLQLMTPADSRASRTEQVGSLSRGLKAMAKELGLPVIALAQLNRAVESRVDRRPQLSDLRDSGEIEQDADLIALLSRAAEAEPERNAIIELALRKHRDGPCGEMLLAFDAERMAFRSYSGLHPALSPRPARRGFRD